MRRFKVPGSLPETHSGFSSGEKKKLILLCVAVLFVVAALGTSLLKSKGYEKGRFGDELPAPGDEPVETVAIPAIDGAKIDALVEDGTATDRVLLEGEAVDALLADARLLTERHFEAMDTPDLDAAGIARILADPASHRAQPFRVRGWIDAVRQRNRGPNRRPETLGRVHLEDSTAVYFLVDDLYEGGIYGSYVRVEGLFLKTFSDESTDEPGQWIEGPLLVGPRAIRSYPDLGEVTRVDPGLMAQVEDDSLFEGRGSGIPFEPLWHLMAYARDLPADAIDWEAVPTLDFEDVRRLGSDGTPFRAQPFRLPVSRLQGVRVRRAGENPARIETYTTGWIGNVSWKNVVHFLTPGEYRDVQVGDYVTARGFFLKNYTYESRDHSARVCPVFVLHSLEVFEPPREEGVTQLILLIAISTVTMIGLFFLLLSRDRRKARELQQELTRRRRARRTNRGGEDTSVGTAST